MSDFDRDLNPLLRRISNLPDGAKDLEGLYERHGIEPSKGPDELASEICLDGGNTICNWLFRWGKGVPYKEIVKDVAEKLGVEVSDASSVKKMEEAILGFVAEKYWSQLSEDEQEEVFEQVIKIDPNLKKDQLLNAMRIGGIGAMFALRGVIGPLIRSIIAKAAGVAISARFAAMFVPGLNVILAIWTVFDFAGPAYRKTVHTVVELGYHRLYHPDD
ncbi:YaaW family protein [Thioalkalivibrio sp. HK1]|uniref:YaaW family protein n=1 Tax=Thioalkalivibrio sp. HK1 TaxID=1469245 RepID=UPI0012DDB003|nr:YaaW family protein [Thioalkalivibrio sp. HK1]